MVLGELSGVLPQPQMKSPSVPEDPKKHFGKFEKKRKIMMVFHCFEDLALGPPSQLMWWLQAGVGLGALGISRPG